MHEANRRGWDAASAQWQAGIDTKVDWRNIPGNIRIVLDEVELKYLGDVSGRSACVLGSGDNLAALALAAAGARVTSVDVSQAQLDIAAGRAEELGLTIDFHRADVTELGGLGNLGGPGDPGGQGGPGDPGGTGDPDEPLGDPDEPPGGGFDIVYTGGHVAVWVSDLERYYGEAIRILKPGGIFMVNEYHPFRRIWKPTAGPLKQEYHYFDHGPLAYDRSEDLSDDPDRSRVTHSTGRYRTWSAPCWMADANSRPWRNTETGVRSGRARRRWRNCLRTCSWWGGRNRAHRRDQNGREIKRAGLLGICEAYQDLSTFFSSLPQTRS